MRNRLIAALSLAIFTLSLLAGCSGNSDSSNFDNVEIKTEKAELSGIVENFSESIETIRNTEYDNLNFKKAVFTAPQIDKVSRLTVTPLTGIDTDELYSFFCDTVDKLTDNRYTDEEKKYEIRFVDADLTYETDEEKPKYPYDSPDIDDYKNGLETEYPWPTIHNDEYFIDMMYGVLRGFDNGALIEYDEADWALGCAMYFMIDNNDKHHAYRYVEDLSCEDTYQLLDGEISIKDAAEFAQNYLDNLDFTPYEGNIPTPKVVAVNVVKIGGGYYGYNFITTVEYNGMDFNYSDYNGSDCGVTLIKTDYDDRNYNSSAGSIDMIETDKIHHFLSIAEGVEITEGEPQTSVITLEYAADCVSKFFSGAMNFTVLTVSPVWLTTKTPNELKAETAYPCWKFKMNANGNTYHTFVDMLTGEIYLYVQAV